MAGPDPATQRARVCGRVSRFARWWPG